MNGTDVEEKGVISKLNVFPNPSNNNVQLSFKLKEAADVKVELLDVTGRVVSTISDKKNQVGEIVELVNTSLYSNGTYIVKINANGQITQQKLNIVH